MTTPDPIETFLTRWQGSGAAERANFQQFAVELCDLLGVDRPDPSVAEERHNGYVFEKSVPLPGGTQGCIDLYKRGCFVMEAKQGRIHVIWALAAGSTLEDRPRYNNSSIFETFPFPDPTEAQMARIRDLGERLDAHRKRQQAQHPALTLTDMYNVLEKLRAGDPLTAAERTIHEWGLVSVLRQLHDDLDAAVADAYGWPAALPDEEILARLVDLNAVRRRRKSRVHPLAASRPSGPA